MKSSLIRLSWPHPLKDWSLHKTWSGSPSSVIAKTYWLVVGDEPGESKVTKAREFKVPIVQGADFQNLLDNEK